MDSLTPSIKFRVAGFTPNDNAYKFVLQVIQPAMLQMELTNADVRIIIIADNDHYGAALKEFSANDGFTNDGIYQGIGKTLPHFENGIYTGSNLVMHQCVMGSFTESDEDGLVGERDAMRYAIYHELGHCVDHRRRPVQHTAKPRENVTSFVLRCAEANSATLLSDYAACLFSASFMTSAGFSYIANSTAQNLKQYLEALAEKRNRYCLRFLDLTAVRNAAIETFWRGMIEYAKFFAYSHGNPALAQNENASLIWPGTSRAGGEIMQSMFSALREVWNSYPNCAEIFEKTLTDKWFAISEAEGYQFKVKPEGDYLWLCK